MQGKLPYFVAPPMEDDEDSEHDDEVLGLGEDAIGDATEKVSLYHFTAHLSLLEAFLPSFTEMCSAQLSSVASLSA